MSTLLRRFAVRFPFLLLTVVAITLWTTTRHEFGHVLGAFLEGAEVTRVRILPGVDPELGFYFGLVAYRGPTSWWTTAAPFLLAWLVAALGGVWLFRATLSEGARRWGVLLLLISPLIDTTYGYLSGLWRPEADVFELRQALPELLVHVAFLLAIGAMTVAVRSLRTSPSARR